MSDSCGVHFRCDDFGNAETNKTYPLSSTALSSDRCHGRPYGGTPEPAPIGHAARCSGHTRRRRPTGGSKGTAWRDCLVGSDLKQGSAMATYSQNQQHSTTNFLQMILRQLKLWSRRGKQWNNVSISPCTVLGYDVGDIKHTRGWPKRLVKFCKKDLIKKNCITINT